MKYVVSVSKTYIHRGNHKHKSKTKKHWYIYYYEDGKFRTEKVNFLIALYYKTRKQHRIRGICQSCGGAWTFFVKSKGDKLECPICLK